MPAAREDAETEVPAAPPGAERFPRGELLLACALMGVHISAACPEGYQPDPKYVEKAQELAVKSGATVHVGTDVAEAVKDADAAVGGGAFP